MERQHINRSIMTPEVLFFITLLKQMWFGYCTVTGSSILHYFLTQQGRQTTWAPNDIDIYVPRYPLHCERGMSTTIPHGIYIYLNFDECLQVAIDRVKEQFHVKCSSIKTVRFINDLNSHYSWMYMFYGLYKKHEFYFTSSTGVPISAVLQVLLVDAYSYPLLWDHFIIHKFDANIVKAIAQFDVTSSTIRGVYVDPLTPTSVQDTHIPANNIQTVADILGGQMVFTFRRGQKFEIMWKRLRKYKSRGFRIRQFLFEEPMLPEWKAHILFSLQSRFARVFAYNWFQNCYRLAFQTGKHYKNTYVDPMTLIETYILPHFKQDPVEKGEMEVQMLRRETILQLEARHGMTVNGRYTNPDRLRERWFREFTGSTST